MLFLLGSTSASAQFLVDGICYGKDGSTCFVLPRYKCPGATYYEGDIVIPETINYEGQTLTVEQIDWYAFQGCSALTSIVIPNSITNIGGAAFDGCSGLTEVTIPNSVIQIWPYAFRNCDHLTSVIIGEGVTNIGGDAFRNCVSLKKITIPNSVTLLSSDAFYGCTSLSEVIIGKGVQFIENGTFRDCTQLTQVTIVDGTERLRGVYGDFLNCPVETVYLGRSCEGSIINNNNTLTNLVIGDSVKYIGTQSFASCEGLSKVVIPNNVTEIGERTFAGCIGLIDLTLGDSLKTIGKRAFWGCKALQEVVIPDSVTFIESEAFSGCSDLMEVTLGKSVESIGNSAFSDCYFINSVTSLNPIPPTVVSAFSAAVTRSATLHVPVGSKAAYEQATHWKNFSDIQEDVDTGIESVIIDNQNKSNIYTLDGMKFNTTNVSDLPKGIYIIKGKKVVVK